MEGNGKGGSGMPGGWAGWLLRRLRRRKSEAPRLMLVERVALAPRQSVCLMEADGRRVLLATSVDGAPAFFALDGERRARVPRRVTW